MKPKGIAKRRDRDWPRKIVVGSVTIPVYKVKHPTNRSGFAYVVVHSSPSGRKTQKFADLDEAIQEARVIAARLSAGRVEGSALSSGAREEYVAAKRLVG